MDVIPFFKGDTQTWTLLNDLVYWYLPPAILFLCRLLLTIPVNPPNNFCLSIHRGHKPSFSYWNFLSFSSLAYKLYLIVSASVIIIKHLRESKRIKEKRMTWAHSFRDFNLLPIQLLWGLWWLSMSWWDHMPKPDVGQSGMRGAKKESQGNQVSIISSRT